MEFTKKEVRAIELALEFYTYVGKRYGQPIPPIILALLEKIENDVQ